MNTLVQNYQLSLSLSQWGIFGVIKIQLKPKQKRSTELRELLFDKLT